jgi:lipid A 3-O-deacylase
MIRAITINLFLSLFISLILLQPAIADDVVPVSNARTFNDDKGSLSLAWENDIIAGRDDNYTNGVRLSYLSPETSPPELIDEISKLVPIFNQDGHKRWGIAAGQNMYTPQDITIKAAQPDDRPWAGWSYASINMLTDTGQELDNLVLTLGVVGPASGAAETQEFIHETFNADDPKGWGNQLHNEIGAILTYEHKWRGLYEFSPFGFGLDITPSLGGSVGNIYTHAAVGTVVRFGYDLPADYGPPLIRPNLPGSDFFIPDKDLGWYLFAGFEARAVAQNIFLDGNTWRDSPSVDKKLLVGGLQGGAAITFGDTRLAYTHVIRSKEFYGQPRPDMYGALTLSWRL